MSRKNRRRVIAFEILEERHALSGFAAHFDFGTATSPVAQSFTRVTDRTTYSPAQGYGWTAGKILSGDRGGKNSFLTRDFNQTKDGTFAVDVPDGRYQVDMILGDVGVFGHDQVGIFLEGALVDSVTTKARQVVSRRYQVDVSDSQLLLRVKDLGGKDANGVIESLELASLGPVVPKLSVSDVKLTEGTGGSRDLVFDLKLSVPSEQDVSVQYGTSNGTAGAEDYVHTSGTLIIPAGKTNSTIAVSIQGDDEVEGDETLFLNLSNPSGVKLANTRAIGTIQNDDQPRSLEQPRPATPNIPGATFSKPSRDKDGFVVYSVNSNYQRSSNTIRVLLPSNYDPTKSYRVVYVLPVEKGNGRQFGDGLVTARNHGLQNTYNAIFVAPTFSDHPWYADHVSNSRIWQETYFRKVVVPFVENQYGIDARPDNRLLLGFSKSGYGAVSMLLRFPETFGRAATFDSPLTMSDPKAAFGFLDVLGSRQNFTQNYQVTSLIANRGSALTGSTPRIILLGYSNSYSYYRDHASINSQLTRLGIPHIHATGVLRSHVWHSGWMTDAAKYLLT